MLFSQLERMERKRGTPPSFFLSNDAPPPDRFHPMSGGPGCSREFNPTWALFPKADVLVGFMIIKCGMHGKVVFGKDSVVRYRKAKRRV